MSKKDVDAYYNKVCQDYTDMIEAIHDLEDECNKGLVSPDRVDMLKEQIEPLKTNYMRWSYMMFLLNKPTRKSKTKSYERQNAKVIAKLKDNKAFDVDTTEDREVIQSINEKSL